MSAWVWLDPGGQKGRGAMRSPLDLVFANS